MPKILAGATVHRNEDWPVLHQPGELAGAANTERKLPAAGGNAAAPVSSVPILPLCSLRQSHRRPHPGARGRGAG